VCVCLTVGAGEYLSSKAHRDFVLTEKRREQWEYKNYKEGEIKEMVLLFSQRGMSTPDAEIVVKKMAEYEEFFVNLMVTEELGLQLPDEDDVGLLKDGLVMFLSFAFFGTIPLLPFLLGLLHMDISDQTIAMVAVGATALALFLLGSIKSTFR
jgi:vacuolar iron transporter family protein